MNAQKEFLNHIVLGGVVKCAQIRIEYLTEDYERQENVINLPLNWNPEEWANFLNKLDLEYDNGYGTQHLFGTIWYQNGNWSSRSEYDGSEWWTYNSCPTIPEELNEKRTDSNPVA